MTARPAPVTIIHDHENACPYSIDHLEHPFQITNELCAELYRLVVPKNRRDPRARFPIEPHLVPLQNGVHNVWCQVSRIDFALFHFFSYNFEHPSWDVATPIACELSPHLAKPRKSFVLVSLLN